MPPRRSENRRKRPTLWNASLNNCRPRFPTGETPVPPTQKTRETPVPPACPAKLRASGARQFARQQRELRDALQRATKAAQNERPVVTENPVEKLAREQADVARQAADLAHNVDREQGEKAAVSRQAEQVRQSARQAARQMHAGALPQAQQAGQQTAEQLRQLAAQLARVGPAPRQSEHPEEAHAPDPLQQARQLEKRQKDINRRLQPLSSDAHAQAAQQQAQQRQLQHEAGELEKEFQRLAQQARTSPPMQSALHRASSNSHQAEQAMQQARQQAHQGASAAEKQSQERAAQALDQAAHAASEAARHSPHASAHAGMPKSSEKSGSPHAGAAVAKAGQHMAAAQGQLHAGQHAQAQSSMKQAAQSLAQAAARMAAMQQQPGQPGQPGQPIGLGRQAGGVPDLSAYGLDKAAYAGKTWGELPGELRTKIMQDMKARYGDDYARMIKYYFEQIADTRKK